MARTPVLDMEDVDLTSRPSHFTKDLESERTIKAFRDDVDRFAGQITGSFASVAAPSGSASDMLGDGGVIGSFYAREDRVIKEVVAWAATSGSGGVTRVDVAVQGPAGDFVSIFGNNALKPAVSSSLGNYGISQVATFISGSNMRWVKGKLMRVSLDTAAGAAGVSGQKGLTVSVIWDPSGSR